MIDRDLSVELLRLPSAREQLPDVVSRYADIAIGLDKDLKHSANPHQSVSNAANSLWQKACADFQSNLLDDRSLYWRRLLLTKTLYDHDLETLVPVVDQVSRNLVPHVSRSEPQAIFTGFDPFGLNTNVQQCNPSGAFALPLNRVKIGNFRVKSMIFPVRYTDFDGFCVDEIHH